MSSLTKNLHLCLPRVGRYGLSLAVACLLSVLAPGTASALEVIELTPDAANSITPAFGTTLEGALNDPFQYNPLNPTNPTPNQGGAAGPHAAEPEGAEAFFSYTFSPVTLTAGQEFVIDVYGRDDGCCTTRDDDFDIELFSGGIGGTLVDSITGLGLLNDPPAHVRATLGSVGDTFDSFRLVARDPEPTDGSNFFLLQEIRAAVIDDAFTRLTIDRQTGATTLLNNTGADINIIGYSLTSAAGGFEQASWTTISGNVDAAGNGTVDADDNWTVLSAPSSDTDLSEGELDGGNGGVLATGAPVDLGTPWRSTPFEDVVAKILLDDGTVETMPVIYEGTAIEFGDLDGVPGIGVGDWIAFKAGHGTDFTDLSQAAGYLAGDLDGDGDRDLFDFGIFEEAFDLANGAGSFAAMVSGVPEPSSMALLALCGAALVFRHKRRGLANDNRRTRTMTFPTIVTGSAALLATLALATSSQAQVNVALGQPVIQSTNGFGFNGSLAVDGNRTGNSISHTATGDFMPFMEVDLGQLTPIEFINVATRDNCCTPGQPERDYNILVEIRDAADAVVFSSPIFNPWDGTGDGATDLGNGFVFEVDLIGSAVSGHKVRVSKTQAFSGSEWLHIAELEVFKEIPRLTLDVNTITGNMTLTNATTATIGFDSYQILSAMDSLNPSGWNSIAERATAVPGFPQGDGSGNGWEEGAPATAGELIEWYLDDEAAPSSLASGASINLGAAYDTTVDSQDVEFYFRTLDGDVVSGFVNYITTAVAGDYNGDGVVNAADYTVWRDNLGASVTLPNENPAATTPGLVDQEDYDFWKSRFGATSGSGSLQAAAVPEPAALALLLGVGLAGVLFRQRAREEGAKFMKRNHGVLCRGQSSLALFCIVAWAVVGSTAQAAVTNDREYWFGEDGLEGASDGAVIGSNNTSPLNAGDTADSIGPTGAFLDLIQSGGATYANVGPGGLARPGAAAGEFGARFDGVGGLLEGIPLNRPDEMAGPTAVGAGPLVSNYPFNYDGITARGAQMWVYPESAKLGVSRQVVLMDTVAAGGVAITADGNWTQINDGHANDTDIQATVPVVGDQWHHVMHHVFPSGSPGAPQVVPGSGLADLGFTGVVYVNGVAVSGNNDAPNPGDLTAGSRVGKLSVGAAELPGDGVTAVYGDFFQGVVDDLEMYVFGDNTSLGGQDYGTFDLFADNAWIAQTIIDTVPGGVLQPGDVNKDGIVSGDGTGPIESDDVSAFIAGWLSTNTFTGAHNTVTVGDWLTWEQGDMNHDGITDLADLFIMNQALANVGAGRITAAMLNGQAVPEPTSLAILGLSATALLLRRRCRRRSIRS